MSCVGLCFLVVARNFFPESLYEISWMQDFSSGQKEINRHHMAPTRPSMLWRSKWKQNPTMNFVGGLRISVFFCGLAVWHWEFLVWENPALNTKRRKNTERKRKPARIRRIRRSLQVYQLYSMICIVLEKETPNKIHGILLFGKIPNFRQLPMPFYGIRFPPWQVPWRKSWSLVHRAEQHWRSCCRKPSPWYVRPKTMGGKPTERYHPGNDDIWGMMTYPYALSKVSFSKDVSFLDEFPFPKGGRC